LLICGALAGRFSRTKKKLAAGWPGAEEASFGLVEGVAAGAD
jgi:hypothetical protein